MAKKTSKKKNRNSKRPDRGIGSSGDKPVSGRGGGGEEIKTSVLVSPVKSDLPCDSLARNRDKAHSLDLNEMAKVLDQACQIMNSNSPREQKRWLESVAGKKLRSNATNDEIHQKCYDYCDHIDKIFRVFRDVDVAQKYGSQAKMSEDLIDNLAPKGEFDRAHLLQSTQFAIGQRGTGIGKVQKEFEAMDPINTIQRKEEFGYQMTASIIQGVTDTEELNDIGKLSWQRGGKWAAECAWKRATELDGQNAKYWSNLAFARINLGRKIRSEEIGYRGLAERMIHQAIEDATMGMKVDPKWERSYQRAAEAHFALGPYDRAEDACAVLQQAMGEIEAPSKNILQLLRKAEKNANMWCSLNVRFDQATIPDIINASLQNLRCIVVQSLAIDDNEDDFNSKAGDNILEALQLVIASLEMIYTRSSKWEKESKKANMVPNDIQIALRTIARVVPLHLVVASQSLKDIIFMEGKFTFWGLDRLDRLGVNFLAFDAQNPCQGDLDGDKSKGYEEMYKRMSGGKSMPISHVPHQLEYMHGKMHMSFDQDMTPHHICAFTITIMERIILSVFCPLREEAIKRVIDISLTAENNNGSWAGGEFLGMAISAASGMARYDIPADPVQTRKMFNTRGGVATMSHEIMNSGDPSGVIQKMFTTVTPGQWAMQSTYDIYNLLITYVRIAMDESSRFLSKECSGPYVTKILANIFDGYPAILDYFRSGKNYSEELGRAFSPLFMSGFGIFIMRNYHAQEEELKEDHHPHTTKNVMNSLMNRWLKLSRKKRSAYRWEAMPEATKMLHSNLKPVSKVDLFSSKAERSNSERQNKSHTSGVDTDDGSPKKSARSPYEQIKELPQCPICLKKQGFGVLLLRCPCKLVSYCSKECQKAHWSEHKIICRQALKSKK